MARLTRRAVLGGLGLAALALALGAAAAGFRNRGLLALARRRRFEELHERVLRAVCDRLPRERALGVYFYYLELHPEAAPRYVAAHREAERAGRLTPLYADFYDRFLLSTDFFPNGADESRPVRFLAFYDPRVSPCYNPLAPPRV